VATKCDLAPAPADWLPTSAVTGAGLSALRTAIAAVLRTPAAEPASVVAATGARCRGSLVAAGAALRSAAATLTLGGGDELVACDLRLALEELGKVVGAVVTDEILDRIFARFCIGK
jgi:tRNA modification GTPase